MLQLYVCIAILSALAPRVSSLDLSTTTLSQTRDLRSQNNPVVIATSGDALPNNSVATYSQCVTYEEDGVSRYYALYSICPTCNEPDKCYGDHMIELKDYLHVMLQHQYFQFDEYCLQCQRKCPITQPGLMDIVDCDYCVPTCIQMSGGIESGILEVGRYYDCDYIANKADGSPLYAGPVCTEDGEGIDVAVFEDDACLKKSAVELKNIAFVDNSNNPLTLSDFFLNKVHSKSASCTACNDISLNATQLNSYQPTCDLLSAKTVATCEPSVECSTFDLAIQVHPNYTLPVEVSVDNNATLTNASTVMPADSMSDMPSLTPSQADSEFLEGGIFTQDNNNSEHIEQQFKRAHGAIVDESDVYPRNDEIVYAEDTESPQTNKGRLWSTEKSSASDAMIDTPALDTSRPSEYQNLNSEETTTGPIFAQSSANAGSYSNVVGLLTLMATACACV